MLELTHLSVISGSRAYGFANADSDVDTRGIKWKGGLEHLLGYHSFELEESSAEDTVYYSFKRFVQLAQKGSFNQLDILFTRPSEIVGCDQWGRILLDNREKFLNHNGIYNSCAGFSKGLYKEVEQKMRNGTEARRVRKCMHHAVRVLYQAINYFNDGTWMVNVSDVSTELHQHLLDIKNNGMDIEMFKTEFENLQANLNTVYAAKRDESGVDHKQFWEQQVINYHLWLLPQL